MKNFIIIILILKTQQLIWILKILLQIRDCQSKIEMIILTHLLLAEVVKVLRYITWVPHGMQIHTQYILVLDLTYDCVSVFSM